MKNLFVAGVSLLLVFSNLLASEDGFEEGAVYQAQYPELSSSVEVDPCYLDVHCYADAAVESSAAYTPLESDPMAEFTPVEYDSYGLDESAYESEGALGMRAQRNPSVSCLADSSSFSALTTPSAKPEGSGDSSGGVAPVRAAQ